MARNNHLILLLQLKLKVLEELIEEIIY